MDKYIPSSFAATTLDVLNPNRSVIIDMIMVQIISFIVALTMILLFKGDSLGSEKASYLVIGIFASTIFLSAVYSRITRGV